MSDFKREIRYIVIKYKDLNGDQYDDLRHVMNILSIPTRTAVVVEDDNPIYEDVWKMIEQQVMEKQGNVT